MSRAFVKDADAIDELPDRPISGHPNEVTREGLRQIESALTAAQEAYAAAQVVGDREGLASCWPGSTVLDGAAFNRRRGA